MASPMVELIPQQNQGRKLSYFDRLADKRGLMTPEQPPQEMMDGTQDENESPLSYATRTAGRTIARAGEEAIGLPGNLIDVTMGLGSYLTGGAIPTYGQVQEKLPISAPTSKQVKEGFTEKLTGDYLKPQTKGEEYYDDLVGTTASLLIPGAGGLVKGGLKAAGKTIAKNAMLAVGADLAGRGTESLTGSPLAGGVVKVGALMLGTTAIGSKRLGKVIDERYQEARDIATSKNLRGETTKLSEDLSKISKKIPNNLSLSAAEETEMSGVLNKILNRVGEEREIGVAEALARPTEATRSFAPALEEGAQQISGRGRQVAQGVQEGGLVIPGAETATKAAKTADELAKSRFFLENGKIKLPSQITATDAMEMLQDVHSKWDKATRGEKRVLSGLSKSLNEFISDVGKGNSGFMQAFKDGQELFRAKEAGPELLQWLNKNVSFKNYMKNYMPLSGLGTAIALSMGPAAAGKAAIGLGGLLAGKNAWNVINVIEKSPLAAKHFRELAIAASKNNSAAMINAFRKLDKEAAKIT